MLYVIVDTATNSVFGVVDDEYKVTRAELILEEVDPSLHVDFIKCPINELEIDGQTISLR